MEPVELQIGSKKLVLLNFIQKSNFFLNLFKFDHFVNLKFENFKNNWIFRLRYFDFWPYRSPPVKKKKKKPTPSASLPKPAALLVLPNFCCCCCLALPNLMIPISLLSPTLSMRNASHPTCIWYLGSTQQINLVRRSPSDDQMVGRGLMQPRTKFLAFLDE